jgi:hypothetical protein
MVTDVLKPKAFAGLFSAAPSVAIASLALTAVLMTSDKAAQSALTMIAGAIGMIAFCVVAAVLEKRDGAIVGAGVAWLSWVVIAGLVFWVFLQ